MFTDTTTETANTDSLRSAFENVEELYYQHFEGKGFKREEIVPFPKFHDIGQVAESWKGGHDDGIPLTLLQVVCAVEDDHLELVKYLLGINLDLASQPVKNQKQQIVSYPLNLALSASNFKIAKLLLDTIQASKNPSVNTVSFRSTESAKIMVYDGHKKTVPVEIALLYQGEDDIQDLVIRLLQCTNPEVFQSKTFLKSFFSNDWSKLSAPVQEFFLSKIDLGCISSDYLQKSALDFCARSGDVDKVKKCLGYQFQPDEETLVNAILSRNFDCVSLILDTKRINFDQDNSVVDWFLFGNKANKRFTHLLRKEPEFLEALAAVSGESSANNSDDPANTMSGLVKIIKAILDYSTFKDDLKKKFGIFQQCAELSSLIYNKIGGRKPVDLSPQIDANSIAITIPYLGEARDGLRIDPRATFENLGLNNLRIKLTDDRRFNRNREVHLVFDSQELLGEAISKLKLLPNLAEQAHQVSYLK